MATSKKEALAVQNEIDRTPGSQITYANDVVATIVGLAVKEVDGIAGMVNVSGGGLLGKKGNVTKGIKVEVGTEEASVDLYIVVEYGTPIQKAAQDCQENVRKAVESMTGLHVVRVDVHVQGVSFEKENSALEAGKETAALSDGSDRIQKSAKTPKAKEPKTAKQDHNEAEAAAERASETKSDVAAQTNEADREEPRISAETEDQPGK